jgi:hypothetical protein
MLAPGMASSWEEADFRNELITFQPHLLNFASNLRSYMNDGHYVIGMLNTH